jgi:dihydropyrimidine dehydrogenase (NAD+) subunit PreA
MGTSRSIEVDFVGIHFLNPFILASAPPTASGEMIERAFELGWGGAVIKTLAYDIRQTQNVHPRIHSVKQSGKIIGFSNFELGSPKPVDLWLKDISRVKKKYPNQVLFASLLHTEGLIQKQWIEVAKRCAEAGVDGLELNFSCPHGMAEAGGGAMIGGDVNSIKKILSWLRREVDLPIMVKLPAMVDNLPRKALVAKESGADAISAINTINSLPGVDVYNFAPDPQVGGESAYSGLSGPAIKPIGLRCVAQIASNVDIPISGIGGIKNWEDAVQYFLVGASTVQVCSGVMQWGYQIIKELKVGLQEYMGKMGFSRINDFVGLALPKIRRHNDLRRDYRVLSDVDLQKCIGCGFCSVVCNDSGYQAIQMFDKRPIIDREKCDGCGLCIQICPVSNCMTLISVHAK